MLEINSRSE